MNLNKTITTRANSFQRAHASFLSTMPSSATLKSTQIQTTSAQSAGWKPTGQPSRNR